MPLRIAIGELSHETNTFCAGLTTLDEFKRFMWFEGEAIRDAHAGNRTYVGGMLDRCQELGVVGVPTFATMAYPSGTISAAAFGELMNRLLSNIRAALPIDAVALALHGAGVAEGHDDLEAEILRQVRALVGPDTPVAATLDLHGNLTEAMLDNAQGLFGVHQYPHVDSYERGAEIIDFLLRVVRGQVRPVMHLQRLPMMIATTTTDLEPMKGLNELAQEAEKHPGVIDCTIFHGFPMTDVPGVGVSVLAIADGDAAAARSAAKSVADAIWEVREGLRPEIVSPSEAIERASAAAPGMVVINDTSDNPGGGAPGDSTHLLRALLQALPQDACFGSIYDPDVARQAHAAGAAGRIGVILGGKTDPLHGEPIEANAYVKVLTDGRFRHTTPMWRGLSVDLGPCARLQIRGIDVIVSSSRQQVLDDEIFLLHGIDVRRRRIVALKSSQHFRAGFAHLASAIVTANAPGATSLDLHALSHQRVSRPLWPLDADAAYAG
jgi:microcystin degradation protein MlrC